MRQRYDVIVVGTRVAGSTLAALLGDAGLSVLLVDSARLPTVRYAADLRQFEDPSAARAS